MTPTRPDLNRQPTVTITHNQGPADKVRRIKGELGITCSTAELLRRMEPEAGLEPTTTCLIGDNPILRPVERTRRTKGELGTQPHRGWGGI